MMLQSKNNAWATLTGPYVYLVRMMLIGLVLLSVSRLLLVGWLYPRVAPAGNLADIFLQGIRADVILLSLLAAIPVLLALPFGHATFERGWRKFSYGWSLLALLVVIFLELSTPSFILQYDIRPNRLYVEYLKYPKEVFSTLWHGFKIPLLLGVALTILAFFVFQRLLRGARPAVAFWSLKKHLLLWPVAVLLVFAGIRSTLEHRPANPAMFAITSDAMVNSLVINSGYSVLYAIYSLKHEARSTEVYGKLPTSQMVQLTRDWPWLSQYQYLKPDFPTLHQQQAAISRAKPLNIVIILQESLGATFVQSLGGAAVSPELEQLKPQGIWFENLYATGPRSVRARSPTLPSTVPARATRAPPPGAAAPHGRSSG